MASVNCKGLKGAVIGELEKALIDPCFALGAPVLFVKKGKELYAKFSKCESGYSKSRFHGHQIVSTDGIIMIHRRLSYHQMAETTTVTEVRKFSGLLLLPTLGLLRYDSSSGFRWFQIYSVHQRKVLGCVLMHTWEGDPPTASSRLKPMKPFGDSYLEMDEFHDFCYWFTYYSERHERLGGFDPSNQVCSFLTHFGKNYGIFRHSEELNVLGSMASSVLDSLVRLRLWNVRRGFRSVWRFLRSYRTFTMSLHVASYPFDQIQPDMSLSEEPESILDRQERVMRNKVIPFVKILWKNHPEREATWETEESMRASYPHFFV
ncbi:putative nucleotidyltransferase, ribonuclease H [Tanacetum coccineum]